MKKHMQQAILFPLLLLLLVSFATGCAEQTAGTSSDVSGEAETNPITSSEAESTAETTSDENSEQPADKSWTLLEFPDSELKQAVESVWNQTYGFVPSWSYEADGRIYEGMRYYGTYGNCVVVFESTELTMVQTITVADETFTHSTSFALLVYADDDFISLENAYENGLLTKEQIAEIAAYHRGFEEFVLTNW